MKRPMNRPVKLTEEVDFRWTDSVFCYRKNAVIMADIIAWLHCCFTIMACCFTHPTSQAIHSMFLWKKCCRVGRTSTISKILVQHITGVVDQMNTRLHSRLRHSLGDVRALKEWIEISQCQDMFLLMDNLFGKRTAVHIRKWYPTSDWQVRLLRPHSLYAFRWRRGKSKWPAPKKNPLFLMNLGLIAHNARNTTKLGWVL